MSHLVSFLLIFENIKYNRTWCGLQGSGVIGVGKCEFLTWWYFRGCLFLGGVLLFYRFSIYNLFGNVSVFVILCSVLSFTILVFPNILTSIWPSVCSLTILFPIHPLTNILITIYQNCLIHFLFENTFNNLRFSCIVQNNRCKKVKN